MCYLIIVADGKRHRNYNETIMPDLKKTALQTIDFFKCKNTSSNFDFFHLFLYILMPLGIHLYISRSMTIGDRV